MDVPRVARTVNLRWARIFTNPSLSFSLPFFLFFLSFLSNVTQSAWPRRRSSLVSARFHGLGKHERYDFSWKKIRRARWLICHRELSAKRFVTGAGKFKLVPCPETQAVVVSRERERPHTPFHASFEAKKVGLNGTCRLRRRTQRGLNVWWKRTDDGKGNGWMERGYRFHHPRESVSQSYDISRIDIFIFLIAWPCDIATMPP